MMIAMKAMEIVAVVEKIQVRGVMQIKLLMMSQMIIKIQDPE